MRNPSLAAAFSNAGFSTSLAPLNKCTNLKVRDSLYFAKSPVDRSSSRRLRMPFTLDDTDVIRVPIHVVFLHPCGLSLKSIQTSMHCKTT